MNTPRVVMTDTKKAFRKLSKTNDVQAAASILCNMKGVSPGMASGEPSFLHKAAGNHKSKKTPSTAYRYRKKRNFGHNAHSDQSDWSLELRK